ncbi:MAG: hypothetical protein WA152_02345 [Microgenomates group bacterium]
MFSIEYLRQFKIGPFAIFDTVSAYLGILLLAPLLTWLFSKVNLKIPVVSWLWFTMPLSVIFHFLFSQPTPVIKILTSPNQPQFYITLLMLLIMVYMGFRKISIIRK